MTIHLLSQLSPSQTLRVPIFKLHCCFIFAQKSSSNRYGFSFLDSILLDFVFFPLDYSHLFMFLRWVCVSAVALCPCLACGCYWFSLILIKLLVLFFIICLARVCYLLVTHLVWSYVDVLIQNVPVLAVRFTVLNICLSIYCVHLSFVLWVMSYSSICMSHWHTFVFWMFSISVTLILPCIIPVVLVYPLLNLFICVVDLSSMRFNCFSSSVWLHFCPSF